MCVRIVTDSSTNVPERYRDLLGVPEVPAIVVFGSDSFLNGVELTSEEFYRRLASTDRLPTTTQPTPAQFAEAYERLAAEGADEIIAVCVSGRLSGTLNSAVMAARHAPVPVHVWDSRHVSLAAGFQAIAAAEMARTGARSQAILEMLARLRSRIHMAFVPANLQHLVASGRAQRLRGTVGDLLNIKPILSTVEGMLEPIIHVRGRRRSLEVMLDELTAALDSRPVRLAVGHCNAPEQAASLMEVARTRLTVAEGLIVELGPVLAALAGPGLIGMGGYTLEE